MKRAEKQTLRAGLVNYLERVARREEETLRGMRHSMHQKRTGGESWSYVLTDWEAFYSLAKTQILVLRRARMAVAAAKTWWQIFSACLVVSSPTPPPPEGRFRCRRPQGHRGSCAPFPRTLDEGDPEMVLCHKVVIPDEEYRDNEEERAKLYRIEEEGPNCPVDDPDCLGGDGDCHDACIGDSTTVIWEGKACRYDSLSQNEKMCLERNEDGVLVGGYRF